jgi:hypothetical protein
MKKIVLLIFFIPLLSLAQNGDLKYYGEKISPQNTVTLKGLINHAKDKSLAKVMDFLFLKQGLKTKKPYWRGL